MTNCPMTILVPQEFPAVQRPYVLFLELCDSLSLSSALRAALTARLRNLLTKLDPELCRESGPSSSSLSLTKGPYHGASPLPSPIMTALGAEASGGADAKPMHLQGHSPEAEAEPQPTYRLPLATLGDSIAAMSTVAMYIGYFSFNHLRVSSPASAYRDASAGVHRGASSRAFAEESAPFSKSGESHGEETTETPLPRRRPSPLMPSEVIVASAPSSGLSLDLVALVEATDQLDLLLLPPLAPVLHHLLWFLPVAARGPPGESQRSSQVGRGMGIHGREGGVPHGSTCI